MVGSSRADFYQARRVYSRRVSERRGYWLSLLGYNPKDRSLANRVYLLYVIAFWSIWIVAVFALTANLSEGLLTGLYPGQPERAAAGLMALALVSWGLLRCYTFSRRSPIIFSEEDAQLLCQTPLDRRAVALTWLAGDWPESLLWFAAGTLLLCIALGDVAGQNQAGGFNLLSYVNNTLRSLSIVVPLHLAVFTLGWVFGVLRLQGAQDRPRLRGTALGLAILWIAALVLNHLSLAATLSSPPVRVTLWPVTYPLVAAFGLAPWGAGLALSWLWALLALGVLLACTTSLNLSRAAQETASLEKQNRFARYGAFDAVQDMRRMQRLGASHAPGQFEAGAGMWALVWKDILHLTRSVSLTQLIHWLAIFSAALALANPAWQIKAGALLIWALLLGQRMTAHLRIDLARWWLWRGLPFSSQTLMLVAAARPAAGAVLVTWLALALAGSFPDRFAAAILVPSCACSVAWATAYDVLRQSKSAFLVRGEVPTTQEVGLIASLASIAFPAGVLALAYQLHWPAAVGLVGALLLSLLIARGLWSLAAGAHRLVG
jgi:hypothetical protein